MWCAFDRQRHRGLRSPCLGFFHIVDKLLEIVGQEVLPGDYHDRHTRRQTDWRKSLGLWRNLLDGARDHGVAWAALT